MLFLKKLSIFKNEKNQLQFHFSISSFCMLEFVTLTKVFFNFKGGVGGGG